MKQIKTLLFVTFLLSRSLAFGQWTEISNIEDRFIQTLNFLDDDLGYALMNDDTGNAPTIMKTVEGGASWVELDLPAQTGELLDIYFYAEGAGFVVIRDLSNEVEPTMLFRTADDGGSWDDISPDATVNGVGSGNVNSWTRTSVFWLWERRFTLRLTEGSIGHQRHSMNTYFPYIFSTAITAYWAPGTGPLVIWVGC